MDDETAKLILGIPASQNLAEWWSEAIDPHSLTFPGDSLESLVKAALRLFCDGYYWQLLAMSDYDASLRENIKYSAGDIESATRHAAKVYLRQMSIVIDD